MTHKCVNHREALVQGKRRLVSADCFADVSKRGVLGSADDDIAFFAYFVIFSSCVDPLVFIGFSLF